MSPLLEIAGDSSSVFLGVLVSTPVAIRVVETPEPQDLEQFHNELEIMRACHHPNVVAFLGSHIQPEKTILLMEYCSEGDLCSAIGKDRSKQFRWANRHAPPPYLPKSNQSTLAAKRTVKKRFFTCQIN
jgi:serine/threonine protein kinase